MAEALAGLELDTPLLAVFMTPGPLPNALRAWRAPEAAARALGRAAAYARWRAVDPGAAVVPPGVDADAAAAVLAGPGARRRLAGARRGRDAARRLGIPLVEQRRVASASAAGRAAAEFGGPVALKAIAPGVIPYKAQAGAVRLGLVGRTAVRRAAAEVARNLDTPVEGFLVQRMAGPGAEMLVGVLADERFGPVVACGAGGGTAEVLGDIGVRLAPLTHAEAREMIAGLRSLALLRRAGADLDALADIAVRVGALADADPAIAELDCNPVMAGPDGAPSSSARAGAPPAVQNVFRRWGGETHRAPRRDVLGVLGRVLPVGQRAGRGAARRPALGRLPAAVGRLRYCCCCGCWVILASQDEVYYATNTTSSKPIGSTLFSTVSISISTKFYSLLDLLLQNHRMATLTCCTKTKSTVCAVLQRQ